MNDPDYEGARTTRPMRSLIRSTHPKDLDAIERYAALEYPRESVTWLLNPQPRAELEVHARLAPGRGNRIRASVVPPRGL